MLPVRLVSVWLQRHPGQQLGKFAFGDRAMADYHAFGARDTFMCITVCMHSERGAYKRIWMHADALHSDAF